MKLVNGKMVAETIEDEAELLKMQLYDQEVEQWAVNEITRQLKDVYDPNTGEKRKPAKRSLWPRFLRRDAGDGIPE